MPAKGFLIRMLATAISGAGAYWRSGLVVEDSFLVGPPWTLDRAMPCDDRDHVISDSQIDHTFSPIESFSNGSLPSLMEVESGILGWAGSSDTL